MAEIVYFLCALTSFLCALLLYRGFHKTRSSLLLWSSVAFSLLFLNNSLLFVDLVLLPEVELHGVLIRNSLGALAGSALLYGLIWEMTP